MAPGTVLLVLAVLTIVSAGVRMPTVLRQGGLVVPGGQVDPGTAEEAVAIRSLSPVSGLSTVTEKVTTAAAPGARVPVQVRTPLA